MRRALIIVVVAALAAATALPAPAHASGRGEVCVASATLYDTPGGLVVGVLVRGDGVRVLRRSRGRTWVRVRSDIDLRGWMRARALC
jgi:hypothetical protein